MTARGGASTLLYVLPGAVLVVGALHVIKRRLGDKAPSAQTETSKKRGYAPPDAQSQPSQNQGSNAAATAPRPNKPPGPATWNPKTSPVKKVSAAQKRKDLAKAKAKKGAK